MMSRRILRTSLAVLLCLVAIPIFVGCSSDKTTAPVTPSGACCSGTNCSVTTQASCGGNWAGANTVCAPNPCGSSTTGTITGTASLPAGVPGNITNSLVSLYTSWDDWNSYRPLMSVASTTINDANISFTFNNVGPGTYYLDVWKDNDLSTGWSNGDFLGVYGTTVWPGMTLAPFQVVAGQTKSITAIVIAINWYKK